jgi:hypothetical protein
MRFKFAPALLVAGLMGVPLAIGCSRTISEKETTTRRPDGTVTHDRQTVKEKPDGSIVIKKDRDVDR